MRLLIVFVCVAAFAAVAFGAEDSGATKVQSLTGLAASGLVPLADAQFGKYVLNKNRPFHIFVLFNAKHPRHGCEACEPFEDEMEVLAASVPVPEAVGSDGLPVFFARADFEANQQTFRAYQLRGVPVLAYMPPTSTTAHKKGQLKFTYAGELTAESVSSFVEDKTGLKIEVYRSPVTKIITLFSLIGIVFLVAKFMPHVVLDLFNRLRASQTVWMVLCLGVYFVSISGVMYDIIRGVPGFGFDPNTRQAQFIHPQSGQQYAVEGLLIGLLNVLCAACVIVLCKYARSRSEASDRVLYAVASGVGFFFFASRILSLYVYKNQWYRAGL